MAATLTATSMIAYQVGAKATRDAFFLSNYPVTALPAMMIATSILAIVLAFASTRALSAWGPERVIPSAFAGSAALLLAEWAISFPFPKVASILVYLHYGCLGALLVSGFWSYLNERFDPRTAKLQLGRITAGGTVGGLLGGLVASLVGRALPVTTMIPVLAIFHLVCAASVTRLRLGGAAAGSKSPASGSAERVNHVRVLAGSPYLRGLIALVVLMTISEGLIELVMKGRASLALGQGGALLGFFAAFYTGISLLTVVAQATVSQFALKKLGPARTAAALPAGVAAASVGAAAVPGLTSAVIAAGVESVVSNSLYRAGYELLFTPVSAKEKRAVKALADVGASKVGGFLAASLAQAVVALSLPMPRAGMILMCGSALCASVALAIALRLHKGYHQTLARAVVSRAGELDLSGSYDAATRSAVLQTLGPMALSQVLRTPRVGPEATRPAMEGGSHPEAPRVAPSEGSTVAAGAEGETSAELERIRDLQSRDLARVRGVLQEAALSTPLLPHVIALLAWDDAARDALRALREAGEMASEHLVSRLLDAEEDFTIRRRVPLVLAMYKDARSGEGLLLGLDDRRFEVRYRCGRALAHRAEVDPAFHAPRETVFQAVLREVQTGAGVWKGRQLLDRMDDESWSPVMDEVIRDRADRSLEHVFTLLALALPRQPLRIAFRGLHTDDPLLRGTALEYLESTLPPEIRKPLWPFLEDNRPKRPPEPRAAHDALQALLNSSESIVLRLEDLKKQR
jgi:hypothetical protein